MNDAELLRSFEAGELTPAAFRHREHLRIAYLYLTQHPFDAAHEILRTNLRRLLARFGLPASFYHETMTKAWLLAVNHFLHREGAREDSEQFLTTCRCLLNQKILFTHYSEERLFSPAARQSFVEPDLDPIPRHA